LRRGPGPGRLGLDRRPVHQGHRLGQRRLRVLRRPDQLTQRAHTRHESAVPPPRRDGRLMRAYCTRETAVESPSAIRWPPHGSESGDGNPSALGTPEFRAIDTTEPRWTTDRSRHCALPFMYSMSPAGEITTATSVSSSLTNS